MCNKCSSQFSIIPYLHLHIIKPNTTPTKDQPIPQACNGYYFITPTYINPYTSIKVGLAVQLPFCFFYHSMTSQPFTSFFVSAIGHKAYTQCLLIGPQTSFLQKILRGILHERCLHVLGIYRSIYFPHNFSHKSVRVGIYRLCFVYTLIQHTPTKE